MTEEPTFPRMTRWRLWVLCAADTDAALRDAWAWRCADYRPDSQQSRQDSMADAEALRQAWQSEQLSAQHLTDATSPVMTGVLGDVLLGAPHMWERTAARAAFRAVPGLRA